MSERRFASLRRGLQSGIPIGAGYFAVSFSLGITAKNAGLTAFQATLSSMLLNASAGEYAAFSLIAANGTYFEMALMEAIANIRYLLMSCALSQKLSEKTGLGHRMLMGMGITDEIFGVAVAEPGYVSPFFYYGMMITALSCWALGTLLGVLMGNILPTGVVSALSVGLYGMFLAIIIPETRKNRVVFGAVLISMLLSFVCSVVPLIARIPSGTRLILLTVLISSAAAFFFPIKEAEHDA